MTPPGANPPRRILLVINLLFWAGAETQLRHLAIGLRRLGHEVTLLAVEDATSHVEELREEGVRLEILGARSRLEKLRALPALRRAAAGADVVHCTGWDASLWGRLAAIGARRPAVVTEHTAGRSYQVSRSGASREKLIALHNRLLDRATYATVVVAAAQIGLLESEGVRRESIVRIPNAVPLDGLRRQAESGTGREELGIPADSLVIAHVARFSPPKGQPTTLRAAARLRERFGDVRIIFAGTGTEEEATKRLADEMGADWAHFLGRREDAPALLRAADITVLPSAAEGLPMVLIESMALGTPVVATDVGDVRWLLETVGGGLLVKHGDEQGFTEACARMLGDPGERRRFGEAGARGSHDFDAARMAERYSQVLEAAVTSASLPHFVDELGQDHMPAVSRGR